MFSEDAAKEDAQFKTVSRRTYNRLVNKLMRPTISLFRDDELKMIFAVAKTQVTS
ncbi:hypothetical protein PI125_g3212 [Phytophthora idaei]|uniref:Uncharacterized protein n=1 Tax=Phytophthora cactorum TaxID=29920 RepID=A0A8T1DBQ0_9STRA|nr:hypothetical protein PC115_g3838 [Phytophthora cactorum]KAG3098708.1 hypothetical protein PC122_g3898 [Phytophthora cactorum]KAG3118108.1 hypothetical protein PI125_g3212 [Phytophthora idaei]